MTVESGGGDDKERRARMMVRGVRGRIAVKGTRG